MIIRNGTQKDVPQILSLIKQLAEYENALNEVEVTEDDMLRDGFGNQPLYKFIVAEEKGAIKGMALFYWRYSTWKGKRLYLEDFYVAENARNQGVGKLLFDELFRICLKENCSGIMWQVLEWNDLAIRFYDKYPTHYDKEWVNCSLSKAQIEKMLSQ